MIDIDPGLDTQLQAFFEHIEASAPPPGLTDIDVTAPARRRRAITLMAGATLVCAHAGVLRLCMGSPTAGATFLGVSAALAIGASLLIRYRNDLVDC